MKNLYKSVIIMTGVFLLAANISWADETAPANGSSQPAQATPAPKAKSMKVSKKKARKTPAAAAKEKYIWVCTMCDYKSDKPGKCPYCGMEMVKQKATGEKPKTDKDK